MKKYDNVCTAPAIFNLSVCKTGCSKLQDFVPCIPELFCFFKYVVSTAHLVSDWVKNRLISDYLLYNNMN